jgi:hypothetical protein
MAQMDSFGPTSEEKALDALDAFDVEEVLACLDLRRRGSAVRRMRGHWPTQTQAGIDAGRLQVEVRRWRAGYSAVVVRVRARLAHRRPGTRPDREGRAPRGGHVSLRVGGGTVYLPFT